MTEEQSFEISSTPSVGMSREAALFMALHADDDCLFSGAEAIRRSYFGKKVELCAIINARSGNCGMDCRFCAQSSHHQNPALTHDMLSQKDLHERLHMLADLPLRHVGIVTSGGALEKREVESLAKTLEAMPAEHQERWQGKVCGSLGRLCEASMARLRDAGFTRFHHNLETSECFYPEVCTTQRWSDRLDTVRRARTTGLEVCSGGLFGLGESWEQRVDFALRLREEGVDNVPINFLTPQPGTPLADKKPLEAAEALRIVAVLRHILPTATLRICGGRPTVLGDRQTEVFAAGANALMTGNYLTTAGEAWEGDCAMIAKQGLEMVA